MTLPSSGPISLSMVNVELQRASNSLLSMNDSALRTVAGITTPGSTISMANLLGKSYETIYDFAGTWFGTNISQTGNCQFRITTNLSSSQYAPIFSSITMGGAYLYVAASTNNTFPSTLPDGFSFFSYDGPTLSSTGRSITSFTVNPKLYKLQFYSNDGVERISYLVSSGLTVGFGAISNATPIPATNYNPSVATPGFFRVTTRG